jgi:hypothetical protein
MSVVAIRGNYAAVDSQDTINEHLRLKSQKWRLGKGTDGRGEVCLWTGEAALGATLAHWYFKGAKAEDYPAEARVEPMKCRLIVLTIHGDAIAYETSPQALLVADEYMAFGTGRDFALGAMATGRGVITAVEAACRWCITCGGQIHAFEYKEATGWGIREGEGPNAL